MKCNLGVRKSQIRSIVLNNEIMLRHYLSSLETWAERWWSAFHHSTTSHLHKVGNFSAFTEMPKKKRLKVSIWWIFNIIYSYVGVVIGCICRNKCKKYNLIKILSWRFSRLGHNHKYDKMSDSWTWPSTISILRVTSAELRDEKWKYSNRKYKYLKIYPFTHLILRHNRW